MPNLQVADFQGSRLSYKLTNQWLEEGLVRNSARTLEKLLNFSLPYNVTLGNCLSHLENLKEVSLIGGRDEQLVNLESLRQLKKVSFESSDAGDETFQRILHANCTSLKHVRFASCSNLTDATLQALGLACSHVSFLSPDSIDTLFI